MKFTFIVISIGQRWRYLLINTSKAGVIFVGDQFEASTFSVERQSIPSVSFRACIQISRSRADKTPTFLSAFARPVPCALQKTRQFSFQSEFCSTSASHGAFLPCYITVGLFAPDVQPKTFILRQRGVFSGASTQILASSRHGGLTRTFASAPIFGILRSSD